MPNKDCMSLIQKPKSIVSSFVNPDDGSSNRSNFGSVQRALASSTFLRTP